MRVKPEKRLVVNAMLSGRMCTLQLGVYLMVEFLNFRLSQSTYIS